MRPSDAYYRHSWRETEIGRTGRTIALQNEFGKGNQHPDIRSHFVTRFDGETKLKKLHLDCLWSERHFTGKHRPLRDNYKMEWWLFPLWRFLLFVCVPTEIPDNIPGCSYERSVEVKSSLHHFKDEEWLGLSLLQPWTWQQTGWSWRNVSQ